MLYKEGFHQITSILLSAILTKKGHLVYSTLISYPEVEFLDEFTLSGNSLYMCATSIEKSTNKEKAWLYLK